MLFEHTVKYRLDLNQNAGLSAATNEGDAHHRASDSEGLGEKQSQKHTVLGRMEEGRRPTYIKAHTKHLEPETLDAFKLPWEYDEVGIDHSKCNRTITDFA